jgi:hypothetical protein
VAPISSSARCLAPAVADSLEELAARILGFEADHRSVPRPFRWLFTRADFDRRLQGAGACHGTRRMTRHELAARTTKGI